MVDDPGFVNLMNPKLQQMLKGASAHMNEEVIPDRVDPYMSEVKRHDTVGQTGGLTTAEPTARQQQQPQRRQQQQRQQRVDPYSQVQYKQGADDELIYDHEGDGDLEYSQEEEDRLNEYAARKYPKGSILAQVAENPIDVPEDNRLTGGVPDDLLEDLNPNRGRKQQQRQRQAASGDGGGPVDYNTLAKLVANVVAAEFERQLPAIAEAVAPIINKTVKDYAMALKKAIVNENTKLIAQYSNGNLTEVEGFVIGGEFKLADKNGNIYKANLVPIKTK